MEGEIKNFIMDWVLIYTSVCYCYTVAKIIPKGTARLITFIPVVCLFLVLPLNLHSLLGVLTCFFISWLGNFKLLLLAFGLGPLSDPSLSVGPFFAIACFPIKIQQNLPPNRSTQLIEGNLEKLPNSPNKASPSHKIPKRGLKSPLNYATKALVLALLIRVYDYKEFLNPKFIRFQTSTLMYINLELFLAVVAVLAQALLGMELEPQFEEPYFSTSLQNFWGRRWNLMVSDILKLTTYQPIRNLSTPIVGRKWAFIPGVLITFLVSGLMHELVFYQWGRLRPTWWTMALFIIHGMCLVVEIVLKKQFGGKWRLPPMISGLPSLTFVVFTFCRLCITDLQRFDFLDRTLKEYAVVGTVVKDLVRALTPKVLAQV